MAALKGDYIARSHISNIVEENDFENAINKADIKKSFRLIDEVCKSYK